MGRTCAVHTTLSDDKRFNLCEWHVACVGGLCGLCVGDGQCVAEWKDDISCISLRVGRLPSVLYTNTNNTAA